MGVRVKEGEKRKITKAWGWKWAAEWIKSLTLVDQKLYQTLYVWYNENEKHRCQIIERKTRKWCLSVLDEMEAVSDKL